MTKKQLPWVLRGSDFSKQDWHVAPTAGFQLMFEFLRLSPSYELARKHRTRGLNQRETASLPADFDQVLKTYDLLCEHRVLSLLVAQARTTSLW
jgi:hypothetical protein